MKDENKGWVRPFAIGLAVALLIPFSISDNLVISATVGTGAGILAALVVKYLQDGTLR